MLKEVKMKDLYIDHLVSNIDIISRILIRKVYSKTDQYLKSVGLCRSQMLILRLLEKKRELSLSEISGALQVSSPTVIPWIDKLVAMGYVGRDRSRSDRRFIRIRISDLGAENLAVHRTKMREIVKNTLSALSEEDLKDLGDNFDAIKSIIYKLNA